MYGVMITAYCVVLHMHKPVFPRAAKTVDLGLSKGVRLIRHSLRQTDLLQQYCSNTAAIVPTA